MIKKIFITVAILGITTATFATNPTNFKEDTNNTTAISTKKNNKKKEVKKEASTKECTITADCGDGTTVTANAKDCATAGAMIDAGCK